MKKRTLFLQMLSLLLVVLLAGCSGGSAPSGSGSSAGSGSSGNGAPAGGDSSGNSTPDKTYTITLSSHQSSSSVHHWTCAEFKSRVEERTNGAVTVNLFEDAQLGNERDNIEGVQMGSIQMCLADTGYVANLTSDYNILQLPFLFRDYDHLNEVLNSDIVGSMNQKMIDESGIRALSWYPDGLRDFLMNTPASSVAEFKGCKLRAMESDVIIDCIEALGAAATPIAWGEVYTSIQTNVVEGLEAAPTSLYTSKFYEVADKLIKTEHINLGVTLLMNEAFFQTLPAEYQDIIITAMQEIAVEQQKNTVQQMDEAVEKLVAEGVTVIEIDKEEFRAACEPTWGKYADAVDGGQEIIDAILAVK